MPIKTGVPQGSILGLLLFITYVNGLTSIPLFARIVIYADDTAIYAPVSKFPTITELNKYQSDINELSLWYYNNKPSINSNKTKIMILGINRNNNPTALPLDICIDHTIIEIVVSYNYLGLTINSRLTLKDHTMKIIGIAASKVNFLHYLKQYVNYSTLLRIYKTTILPILEYANVTYPLVLKNLAFTKQNS